MSTQRSEAIRLASTLPVGDPRRRELLAALAGKTGGVTLTPEQKKAFDLAVRAFERNFLDWTIFEDLNNGTMNVTVNSWGGVELRVREIQSVEPGSGPGEFDFEVAGEVVIHLDKWRYNGGAEWPAVGRGGTLTYKVDHMMVSFY